MAFEFEDLINGLRSSRKHFLKHVEGATDEQWTWKPYPECKSLRETVAHLTTDDRAALASLQSGKEPDYDALAAPVLPTRDAQISALNDSFETLVAYLAEKYASAPLDTKITVFGSPMKLGAGVALFSSEDYYHAGQAAFIRMASDPTWDYYSAIYA